MTASIAAKFYTLAIFAALILALIALSNWGVH